MVKLIKYEFIRKFRLLSVSAAIVLLLNAFVLFKLRTGILAPEGQIAGLAVFFSSLLGIFFVLFMVDVILMYSQDLDRKSGYMLFMTPNSGYKILGSKVTAGIIEGLMFLAGIMLLMAINFYGFYGEPFRELLGSSLFQFLTEQIHLRGAEFFPFLAISLFAVFVTIVTLILIVFAAISIRKSILAEKKIGELLSLIIFLLLSWLDGKICSLCFSGAYHNGILTVAGANYANVTAYILTEIVFGMIMFILSGYLLDKKIDL
jgi:hypothetical protein